MEEIRLPKEPNRRKIYYKITNKEERHHGLRYHNGLVIDTKLFNNDPDASCVEGGIYFTTNKFLHHFLSYGCWVRPIIIPPNAKVIRDPDGNKYRADMLIFLPRKDFHYYFKRICDKTVITRDKDFIPFLANLYNEYFGDWFDPKTFPKKLHWMLPKYYAKHFDKWFDPETFNTQNYDNLIIYCTKHFKKWFNPEKISPFYYYLLAIHCSEHFDDWFDPKIFPKESYHYLATNCPDRFDDWFDKEVFPKEHYTYLAIYCSDHFDEWYDPDIYPKEDRDYLLKYCSKQLTKYNKSH